jgi:hypothetical protein
MNADHILAFCHFLVLIQESNQRKSRKNYASPLQAFAHPAIFSAPHTWNNSLLVKLLGLCFDLCPPLKY